MSNNHRNNQVTLTIKDIDALPEEPMIADDLIVFITKAVAQEMDGKTFSRWSEAKDALMKCLYKHHGKAFHLAQPQQVKGRNPFAKKVEQVGEQRRYEVHHRFECAEDSTRMGEMENLFLCSPRFHNFLHRIEEAL
jgi:hypothetical protein